MPKPTLDSLLGGSWAVISGVLSRVTIVIAHIRGLITPLITTHEPPSESKETPAELRTPSVQIRLEPKSAAGGCRFMGFRALNPKPLQP